jgi:predicted DCC family thiol-disulfide oxidoreductase YuxK
MENPYQWPEIVFFDGVCVLCNRSVDLLIRADRRNKLKYASLQAESSKAFLSAIDQQLLKEDTIIFYSEGRLLIKSEAVLKISFNLGFPYSLLMIFKIIPKKWRDSLYDYIARHRFRWFGRHDNCRVPDETTREKILE